MAKEKTQNKVHIKNRRVSFEYFVIDTYMAGIVLTGTEIKSIREGKANLKDSYATIKDGECFVYGMHISPYEFGNISDIFNIRCHNMGWISRIDGERHT